MARAVATATRVRAPSRACARTSARRRYLVVCGRRWHLAALDWRVLVRRHARLRAAAALTRFRPPSTAYRDDDIEWKRVDVAAPSRYVVWSLQLQLCAL